MDAQLVCQLAHGQAAGAKAQHHEGVGQRGVGTRNAKFFLNLGQHHRHHIHAAAAQGHEQQSDEQAPCGVRGVDQIGQGRCRFHPSTLSSHSNDDDPEFPVTSSII